MKTSLFALSALWVFSSLNAQAQEAAEAQALPEVGAQAGDAVVAETAPAPAPAPAPDPEAEKKAQIAALIQEIDALWGQRSAPAKAQACYAKTQELLKLDAKNYAGLWRQARAAYWMADGASNKKQQAKWGKIGWDAGEAGRALHADRVEAQFWGAASLGNYAKGVGVMKAVWDGLGKKYEAWVRKAYSIDRNYANAGPPRALGRYYFTLPGIAGGDADKSIKYLEEAKKIAPDILRTRAWLAEVYLDEDQNDKAKAELDYCLAADVNKGDREDNKRFLPICKELAKKL